MPDDKPVEQPARRASDNGYLAKGLELADIVNRVGLASFIILCILVFFGAVLFGYAKNPFASAQALEEHRILGQQQHGEQIETGKAMLKELREMKCDNKPSDRERLACYRVNGVR